MFLNFCRKRKHVLHLCKALLTSLPGVLTSMTLNDLKPPKCGFFVIFFAIFACSAHFNSELQQNG